MPFRVRLPGLPAPLLLLTLLPAAGSAQTGAPGGDGTSASTFRAEYFADVVPRVNEVMDRWSRAWSADDVPALAALYTDDAVLLPLDGAAVVGRDAVAAHFSASLPDAGAMEAFMQSFDASGGMALVYGTFLADLGPRSGVGTSVPGELVTVFARRGREWYIRAQTLRVRDP